MQLSHVRLCALSVLALCVNTSWAVRYGTMPQDGQVINPYTNQEIKSWKLVGPFGASAVQIHRNWIIMAGHEGNLSGGSFGNPQSNGTQATVGTCYTHPNYHSSNDGTQYDVSLCRLTQALDTYGTYPALVVAPTEIQPANQAWNIYASGGMASVRPLQAKWGYLMAFGYASGYTGLTITDFSGLPINYNPANTPNVPTVPNTEGGDSGGAVYWISPTATDVALVGLLTSRNIVPWGTTYFTQATLDWVQSTITGAGDSPITVLSTSQHFSGTSGPAIPELPSLPTIRSVSNSRSNFALNWPTQQAGTPAISSYQVSLGTNGAITQQLSVAAGLGNTTSLTGLSSGTYIACVLGTGSAGHALPGYTVPQFGLMQYQYSVVQTPNCKTFDTTTAAPGGASGLSATASSAGTVSQVAFNWSASTPTPAAYRLKLTQSYAGGPSRATNVESTTTSYTATVLKGTTVCATVTPLNDIGITGTATSNVCATAN